MTPSIHQDELEPFWRNQESTGGKPPPESPDLNPIENVWHELKFYLETKVKPQTKQELVAGIKKFWARKVTVDKCTRYIDHVLNKVIPAVVEARGAATQY